MPNSKHILVIRLSAMGDVAMTVPVIKTLLAQYPNTRITIVSKSFLKPLFSNMDRVFFVTADVKNTHKGWFGIYKLYRELQRTPFDAVADLHNVLRSKLLRFLFLQKNIPIASINKGRNEKKALTRSKNKIFKPLKTTHNRYANVFKELGYSLDFSAPSLKNSEALSEKICTLTAHNSSEKRIGIAPFAAHQGKKYPLDLMELVINQLSKQGKILLFGGGSKETKQLQQLAKKHPNTFCVAGNLNLQEELALISNLSVMISMDSGNGHFSALYGIPTVTLWGATHPYAGFVPFLQNEHCICADREKYPLLPTSVFGNKTVPGYEDAMRTISPKTIINKVLTIIS